MFLIVDILTLLVEIGMKSNLINTTMFIDPSFRQVVTTHPSLRVGAKGDSFSTITMKVSGYLKSLRLTHKDGLLTCSIYSPKENSAYWGCKNQPDFRMMILVTKMNNDVIMPRKDLVNFNSYMAYDLPGYTVDSDEIVFDGADYIKVEKDEQLRIWFSEDLMKYTTSDNEGEILIDAVSTVIRQIRPGLSQLTSLITACFQIQLSSY